jgi:hypothetical protein
MPTSGDKAARKRLGRLLTQARVELDPRYKNRALFSRERGINYRVAQDAENAASDVGGDAAMRMFISRAYGWTPDSFDTVLAGGEPTRAAQVPPRVLALVAEAWGSLADAPEHIREFAEAAQFPEEFRLRMIQGYIDRDPGRERGSGRHLREA